MVKSRRRKLKLIRKWRRFRDNINNSNNENDAEEYITSLPDFRSISIDHGWETWVTVYFRNMMEFTEHSIFPIDSLIKIGNEIYKQKIQSIVK